MHGIRQISEQEFPAGAAKKIGLANRRLEANSMNPRCQITLKGMPEEYARKAGEAISVALDHLTKENKDFDLRRMPLIIVTTDLAGELAELSSKTASGNKMAATDEEYAVAVAKVLTLPVADDFEILPVFTPMLLAGMLAENPNEDADKQEAFLTSLHYLHHEFCHVHDDNKKLDMLKSVMLKAQWSGKNMILGPLAERCWSEYIANYLSVSTATDAAISQTLECFTEALQRTKGDVDKEVLAYRTHGDIAVLLGYFERHGQFLVFSAAYAMGYLEALGQTLGERSVKAQEELSASSFEPTWNAMQGAFREMHALYPDNWNDLAVFDSLMQCMETYYSEMGLVLSMTAGGLYVKVPFRPETNPMLPH